MLAAYVAGGRAREVPAVMAAMKFGPRDSFEIAFNAACALLGAGDAPAAEQQLLLAQRLGAQSELACRWRLWSVTCWTACWYAAWEPAVKQHLPMLAQRLLTDLRLLESRHSLQRGGHNSWNSLT